MPSFMVALQYRPVSRKPKPDFTRAPSGKMGRHSGDRNPTNDRHGIVGYLDAPNIANKVLDALDA
jgi:hypothetical protein